MRRAHLAAAVGLGTLGALAWTPAAWAIRPTDGTGWYNNGYDPGVAVYSLPSAGGHFRVWYVTTSIDAVSSADVAPADGIPDFVAEVADSAERSWTSAVAERGFRPPLDDSVYHDTVDFGGDGRFDIYLQDILKSDGYRVIEVCTDLPYWCSGYFAMENDFAGFGYPSVSMAIRVLTSHELFHAMQDACDADQDSKWTEGTAVWNEEQTFPEQGDFERLLPGFLNRPERPFDRRGGVIADPYPYGAAIWAQFLTERFGSDVVRRIWEACEDLDGTNPNFLEATQTVLSARHGSSLEEAWVEFTRWNLMTGPRSDPARAYANGADWPSVRIEDAVTGFPIEAHLVSEGMSARYLPIDLPDRQGRPARLTVATPTGAPVRAAAILWDGATLGEWTAVDGGADPAQRNVDLVWSGTPTLYVVVTGTVRGATQHEVVVTLDEPPAFALTGGGCGCRFVPGAPRATRAPWPGIGPGLGLVLAAAFMAASRRR